MRLAPIACLWLCCGTSWVLAQAPAPATPTPATPTPTTPVAPDGGIADPIPEGAELPPEHLPRLQISISDDQIAVGQTLLVKLHADALTTDDVTIPEQTFGPFEVHGKRQRVTPPRDGRHTFVFDLELQAFESGELELPEITLRVVTGDNLVGTVHTPAKPVKVVSALGNEPDAKLRAETEPVLVMQDDYTLLYILAGILAAALVVGGTLLIQRYLQRRPKPEPPPPPPRPPWEIAFEKLGALRRQKQQMLKAGQGVQFVDEVSDAVRECLGSCYGFDGLDTTTQEMLQHLKNNGAAIGLQDEARAYLNRCDLVKFAKVDPDQDEVDLILAKAQDIVQFSTPMDQPVGAAR